MAKRSPRGQSKHDAKVERDAKALIRQGFDVKADLPGFKKPPAIGKKKLVPDIFASKPGKVILEEVETLETNARDAAQHKAFQQSADRRKGGEFIKRIAK